MHWYESARATYGHDWTTKYVLIDDYLRYVRGESVSANRIPGYRHPGDSMNITYYDGHVQTHNYSFFEPHYDYNGYADELFSILQ